MGHILDDRVEENEVNNNNIIIIIGLFSEVIRNNGRNIKQTLIKAEIVLTPSSCPYNSLIRNYMSHFE